MPIEAAPLPIPEHGNERVEHAEVPLTEVKWQHCSGAEVGPPTAAPIRRESAEVKTTSKGQRRGAARSGGDPETRGEAFGFLICAEKRPFLKRKRGAEELRTNPYRTAVS